MNRLERAWTLLETQRFAEAVPLLESAVRDAPTSGEAHYALGTCYRFLENYPAAVEQRDTRGLLWVKYATYGAAYSASLVEGITGIAMPSAASAMEEERTERNAGLYWIDKELPDGRSRVFLPNFFNTIREYFAREPLYSGLLANRARVLEMIGDVDARLHVDEACEFASPDRPPETTVVKWSFPRRS